MKKKNAPKDIEDLVDVCYNPSRAEEREKWDSNVSNIMGAENEKHATKFLSKFGECVRIPTGAGKTFDHKIDESKMLVEATTIQPPGGQAQISNDPIRLRRMISKALNHIDEKDSSGFPGYARGGLVYVSAVLCTMTGILEIVRNHGAEIASAYGLDYVAFVPQDSSTFWIDYDRRAVAFVKGRMLGVFRGRLPDDCLVFECDFA